MINNCSNYVTGIGADSQNDSSSSSTCISNRYETLKGQAASTTGNITGVYDMSGGAYEYVMGVLNKTVGLSGISTWPDAKYYDNYTSDSAASACNSGICYGHALSETSNWYSDLTGFVRQYATWLKRSGYCNTSSGAGVFYFSSNNGGGFSNYSFRVVLTNA